MIYYIYDNDSKDFINEVKASKLLSENIDIVNIDSFLQNTPSDISHLIVTANLENIKKVIEIAISKDVSLGIIPKLTKKI